MCTIKMKNNPSNVRLNMKSKIKRGKLCKERARVQTWRKSLTEKRITLQGRGVEVEASV